MVSFTRREFVRTAALGGLGLALPSGCAVYSSGSTGAGSGKRRGGEFHFVHLTDQHVRSKRKGDEGYRVCIETVNALRPKPDLALMGGDLAFDGNYTPKDEFERQIGLYKSISDELDMPYYNSIGNHDILGWSPRRKVPVDDPDIGKQFIMDRLGMDRNYYSFDHKGWHFVVLDSNHLVETDNGPSQEPRMGEEQLEWLAYDLGANEGKPTIAMTHVAAFCNIGQINGDPEIRAMNHMVVKDNKTLRLILERHKVKALLQGHSHMTEDFCFNGVWYLTSPAVSAAWWGGNWLGFAPAFTVFHCKGDDLQWERVTFPWTAHLEPEDTLEKKKNEEQEEFLKQQEELREKEVEGRKPEPVAAGA